MSETRIWKVSPHKEKAIERALLAECLNHREIAEELGVDKPTVARVVRRIHAPRMVEVFHTAPVVYTKRKYA